MPREAMMREFGRLLKAARLGFERVEVGAHLVIWARVYSVSDDLAILEVYSEKTIDQRLRRCRTETTYVWHSEMYRELRKVVEENLWEFTESGKLEFDVPIPPASE